MNKKPKKRAHNFKDLRGQIFGRLYPLRYLYTKNKRAYWKCRCTCGDYTTVTSSILLLSGQITSCGCKRREVRKNIAGQKFGKLTAIAPTKKRIRNNITWKCACECGNTCLIPTKELNSGNRTTCAKCSKIKPDSFYKDLYRTYRQNAENRELSFDLTIEQFSKIVVRPCYYCRAAPILKSRKSGIKGKVNGVDRANSRLGYSISNCVPCCTKCNLMKSDLSDNEFIEHARTIANRSDGDDYNTRTTYVSEVNVGDTGKVLLLCIYDMVEKFNMQKAEVTGFFQTLLNEHIDEVDLTNEL